MKLEIIAATAAEKAIGKMASIDLFYDKGTLELCTYINEPTNKFMKLSSFIYGIVSFHGGKIRVPGRLTDKLICDGKDIDFSSLEGREVVPRFRRRYSVGKNDMIPTISLAFTLADEYYPHQEYTYRNAKQRIRVAWSSWLRRLHFKVSNKRKRDLNVPFPSLMKMQSTAAVEAGKLP